MSTFFENLRKKINISVSIIVQFFSYLSQLLIEPVLVIFIFSGNLAKNWGSISPIFLGLLLGIFFFAMYFSIPIINSFSERYGRKPALLIGITISIVAKLLLLVGFILNSYWVVIISRFFDGIGSSYIFVLDKVILDLNDEKDYSSIFQININIFWITFLISVMGTFGLFYLINIIFVNFSLNFLVTAISFVLNIFSLILILLAYKETLKLKKLKIYFSPDSFNIYKQINKVKGKNEILKGAFLFLIGIFFYSYVRIYFPLNVESSPILILSGFLYFSIIGFLMHFMLNREEEYRDKNALIKPMVYTILAIIIISSFGLPLDWQNYIYVKYIILFSSLTLFALSAGIFGKIFTNLFTTKSDFIVDFDKNNGREFYLLKYSIVLCAGIMPILAGTLASLHFELPFILGLISITISIIYIYYFANTIKDI